MKFDGSFLNDHIKECLIKNFTFGYYFKKELSLGGNPINYLFLLQQNGKKIFSGTNSFESNNIFPISVTEIHSEMIDKYNRMINLPKIQDIIKEEFSSDNLKLSNYSKKKKSEISLKENSNKASYKDNDNLRVNNFNNTHQDNNNNGFNCLICGCSFFNGQGLGGHMSRKHPNQSEKYQMKKLTREKRNNNREIIYKAKRILLKKFKQDYDHLINYPNGRKLIKKLVKENREMYLSIKGKMKIQN
jgi:hypothetical protein